MAQYFTEWCRSSSFREEILQEQEQEESPSMGGHSGSGLNLLIFFIIIIFNKCNFDINSPFCSHFQDEFHTRLRFIRRGLVAMANAGPHDNGSQFFFTLGRADELNNKHTIFGKVRIPNV